MRPAASVGGNCTTRDGAASALLGGPWVFDQLQHGSGLEVLENPTGPELGQEEDEKPAKVSTAEKLRYWRQQIDGGCSINDVRDEDYEFYMLNRSKLLADMEHVRQANMVVHKEPKQLFVWQQVVLDYLVTCPPDDRLVLFVVGTQGNEGKSVLAKWLAYKHSAYLTGELAKFQDIAYGFRPGTDHGNIVCFHYSRSNGGHQCYSAMEALKDGMYVSSP